MSAQATRKRRQEIGKRRLMPELLESRRMLAGNVQVALSGGTLYLTGDNLDNSVTIAATGTPNQFTVTGLTDLNSNPTSINHVADGSQTFSNVTNISVSLKGGDDFFGYQNGNLRGNLSIDMGDGDDEADIGLPTNFSVSVTSSTVTPQQVTLGISNATICGNLTVNLGRGDNWLQEGSTQVNGCEVVAGCDGDDRVEFKDLLPSGGSSIGTGVIVKKDLSVNLGGGDNYLNAYDLNVCGSMCVTGSGTNEVYLAVFTVGKNVNISLCGPCDQEVFIGPEITLGTPVATIINHVGANLVITTGSGHDDVTEESLSVCGCNTIDTGCGHDDVSLGAGAADDVVFPNIIPPPSDLAVIVGGGLTVKLGSSTGGVDRLTAFDLTVRGDFLITQGLGDSDIELDSLLVAHQLKITTDGGCDNVDIDEACADKLYIDTGAGGDKVTLQAESGTNDFNTVQINLGAGNDLLCVSDTTVSKSTSFNGGTGSNTYNDNGGNSLAHLTKVHFS